MRALLLLALVAAGGCASAPHDPYAAARRAQPAGDSATRISRAFDVRLFGEWTEVELSLLERALEWYADKDLTGLEIYRLAKGPERGARYDIGKIGVYDVSHDVLVHELAHAIHAHAPGYATLKAKLEASVNFGMFFSVGSWRDGGTDPRRGFVTPYAAMNVDECVAESVTAVKLWAHEGRGPLSDVDWEDGCFVRVYDLLDQHALMNEAERQAIRELRARRASANRMVK